MHASSRIYVCIATRHKIFVMAAKRRKLVDVTKIGRLGGLARAANLSPEEMQESNRQAANARWEAYYAAHPEKLAAKLERKAKKGKVRRGRPPKKKLAN
jgi:hypothetical protein